MATSPEEAKIEHVNCPTCSTRPQKHLFQKNGWSIVQCSTCTLAMVSPRNSNCIEIYGSDAYYNDKNYYYDYEGNKAAYQKGFRSKLKVISQYVSPKGKLLDVGAAHGFFMEEASKFGFEPFGVELSTSAAKNASHYGPVFDTPLADVETTHLFSVVSFIDSLEHFEYPIDGLIKARELLENGGIVAIMVPNIDSLFARITKSKWHLVLPEEHLFYFTPRSARLMLGKAGFETIHVGTGGYGRSLAEILQVLSRGRKLPMEGLERFLKKITFEINLGDLFVIGRKAS